MLLDLFSQYAKGEIEISEEGVQEFFSDLGVDAMDPVTLVVSYYMGAKNMGEYSQTEFINGFKALGWSSIHDLKGRIDSLRRQLKSNSEFPKIYKFVFDFLKGEVARNVNVDFALPMWDLLLKEHYGSEIEPFLLQWSEFIEHQKTNNSLNGIKKDEWISLLDLFAQKGTDVKNMKSSDEDCWPILFDSFFEYLKSK